MLGNTLLPEVHVDDPNSILSRLAIIKFPSTTGMESDDQAGSFSPSIMTNFCLPLPTEDDF